MQCDAVQPHKTLRSLRSDPSLADFPRQPCIVLRTPDEHSAGFRKGIGLRLMSRPYYCIRCGSVLDSTGPAVEVSRACMF